jgi:hypothetical protein
MLALSRTSPRWLRGGMVLAIATLVSLALTGCEPTKTTTTGSKGRTSTTSKTTPKTTTRSGATVQITTSKNTCWSGRIGGKATHGCGSARLQVKSSNGSYTVNLHKTKGADGLSVVLVVNGKKVDSGRGNSSSVVVTSRTTTSTG